MAWVFSLVLWLDSFPYLFSFHKGFKTFYWGMSCIWEKMNVSLKGKLEEGWPSNEAGLGVERLCTAALRTGQEGSRQWRFVTALVIQVTCAVGPDQGFSNRPESGDIFGFRSWRGWSVGGEQDATELECSAASWTLLCKSPGPTSIVLRLGNCSRWEYLYIVIWPFHPSN